MRRTAGFMFLAFCAVSALSLAEDEKKSKPSVTMSPADAFSATSSSMSNSTTTATTQKTTTHKTTTHKATTQKTTTHKPPTTTTTHKPSTTTTTHKPPTTTTTHKPPTTTPKHTTTTHKPPTTTPKHTTTTHKPTTTTPKHTTTTPKHTTTTPKTTPPPPPKPTPPVNLTVGNYSLMTDKKVICLLAQMALQIRLATPKTNGTFIVQPQLTKAEGGCQETKANLTLVFKEGSITFMFNKSTADNTVYVDALSFVLSYPFSKGGNSQYSANNKSVQLFTAKVGHSYSCKGESLYMGNGLYLDVNQDRMQAFNLTKNDFGSPDPCAADQPDYRVAIAVGVTLLVLIVIVVAAYLLGRRRRADGYQSL